MRPALALALYLVAVGALAADQGFRDHSRGDYDSLAATYVVVEDDGLIEIAERFETRVEPLKGDNNLSSDEISSNSRKIRKRRNSSASCQLSSTRR